MLSQDYWLMKRRLHFVCQLICQLIYLLTTRYRVYVMILCLDFNLTTHQIVADTISYIVDLDNSKHLDQPVMNLGHRMSH